VSLNAGAAWIDGAIVPIAEARIPIMDWGFLRSDATYDVVHAWDGRFFRLDDHLKRFWRGVARNRYTLPIGDDALRAILDDLLRATGLAQAYVAMIATRGTPQPGSRDPRRCANRFYAFAIPFVWIADPEKQKVGLRMAISSRQRIAPASVDPTVKNYHWLDFQMSLLEAYDHGAETTVLLDADGMVCEGPGFNVFAAKGDALRTPKGGVLEGVTRATVLDICGRIGMPVSVGAIPVSDFRDADEIIITSTAGGLMPVTMLDGAPVGDGAPGPLFTALHEAYWRLHEAPAELR